MADRFGGRRRRFGTVAVVVGALALVGCTGGVVDPRAEFGQVDAAFDDELTAALEAKLDEAVALSGSSGGVAGVWAPWSGEWTGASGTTSHDENAPAVSPETGFHMATLTGEVTCTILLRLVDAGTIALDDEVATVVDWIPGIDGITFEQLCRHTSGLADYYPVLANHFLHNPERPWPPNELLASGLALTRAGAPGDTWRPSRTGIILLATALEERTGDSWNELADRYVFDPLGLDDTELPAATETGFDDLLGAYSAGPGPDGVLACDVVLDVSKQSSSTGWAASGAVTTLDDLGRLSAAFASGALIGEHNTRRQWALTAMGGTAPAWQGWGIGGGEFGPLRGMAGESPGALTAAFTDPDSGLTVVVALNNAVSGADFVRETAFALASIGSKAKAVDDHEQPLVELPWSVDQATAKMTELAKCPTAVDAAEAPPAEG